MPKSLKIVLVIFAILVTIGWLKKNWFPDKYLDESRITPTHFYGIERADPNREVHTYDFKTNHFTYKDEVKKDSPKKVTKHYTITKKKTLDDMVDEKIEDYIEDNYEDIIDEYGDHK